MPTRKYCCAAPLSLVIAVSVVCLRPTPARAQEPPQGVIRVGVNLVLVDATVKTKAGQIMSELKKEDFELREDGVAQNIDVFSRDELALDVEAILLEDLERTGAIEYYRP